MIHTFHYDFMSFRSFRKSWILNTSTAVMRCKRLRIFKSENLKWAGAMIMVCQDRNPCIGIQSLAYDNLFLPSQKIPGIKMYPVYKCYYIISRKSKFEKSNILSQTWFRNSDPNFLKQVTSYRSCNFVHAEAPSRSFLAFPSFSRGIITQVEINLETKIADTYTQTMECFIPTERAFVRHFYFFVWNMGILGMNYHSPPSSSIHHINLL